MLNLLLNLSGNKDLPFAVIYSIYSVFSFVTFDKKILANMTLVLPLTIGVALVFPDDYDHKSLITRSIGS